MHRILQIFFGSEVLHRTIYSQIQKLDYTNASSTFHLQPNNH